MTEAERCIAECQVRRGAARQTHTIRCQKPTGHPGMHEAHDGGSRTSYWEGEARRVEDDTRYRYGFAPGRN